MNDQVDQLLHLIEQLRDALKGRTVSCSACNETARERDKILDIVRQVVDAARPPGHRWRMAWDKLCELVADE